MLAIDWSYGRPHTGADDDEARALEAARLSLQAAGVTDYVAAFESYLAAIESGAELDGDALAWHDALCAADVAATKGWYNPDGAGVSLRAWDTAGAAALRAAGFAIGERIQAGRGEDHDTGQIIAAIDARLARVAWDSGVATPCPIADMTRAE